MGHGREGNPHPKRLSFPSPERDSPGLFAHRPQTPQRSFQEAAAGTHATPAHNRAHSGSHGETRGLLSIGHSVALCCQRNCHRKNSRRKWMHALWRVSAFFGAAAPLGCAAWTLSFPQPRAFQPCCAYVCAYSFITGPCRCSGSSLKLLCVVAQAHAGLLSDRTPPSSVASTSRSAALSG